jgi:hypothetical protein
LYQRLVIAGHSHTRVTVAYGCLAFLGAALASEGQGRREARGPSAGSGQARG